jgi:hypothetical protein
MEFIMNNYEWIFSGIGVFVLGLFIYRKTTNLSVKQKQKIRNNSTGIQANGDVNINTNNK